MSNENLINQNDDLIVLMPDLGSVACIIETNWSLGFHFCDLSPNDVRSRVGRAYRREIMAELHSTALLGGNWGRGLKPGTDVDWHSTVNLELTILNYNKGC